MSWQEQTESMMNSWWKSQKKMWDAFLENIPGYDMLDRESMWARVVEAGEKTVKDTLASQAEMLQIWRDHLADIEDVPDAVVQSTKQFEEMAQKWADTQKALWKNWFNMLKKMDPTQVMASKPTSGQNPFQVWQEMAMDAMKSQLEWMRSWTKELGSSPDEK